MYVHAYMYVYMRIYRHVITIKIIEKDILFMPTIYNSQLFINIYIHNCIYTIGCRLPLHTVLSERRPRC